MVRARPVAAALLAVVALSARPVVAQPEPEPDPGGAAQPVDHEARGLAAEREGDLATAIREFEAAHADTRRPELLYVLGRLHSRNGECEQAITRLREFLASEPGPNATASAEAEISHCEEVLAGAPPPPPPEPVPLPPPPPPGARPFYTDVVGDVLVGGGAVAIVGGTVMAMVGYRQRCDAPQDGCPEDYQAWHARQDRAAPLYYGGITLGVVGVGLVAAGVVRFRTHRRGPRSAVVDVTVVPSGDGANLVVGGRF